MSSEVNLDALIARADFEVQSEGEDSAPVDRVSIRDLEPSFFFSALRKPDFQRETAAWNAEKVVGLIKSFLDGDLIPAVILWRNRDLVFVIDGSHRLCALIAWVHDDYGDGAVSQKFFDYQIPEEQKEAAEKVRSELARAGIVSYDDHKKAILNPDAFGPDIVSRARRLGSLSLQLQWVRGNAAKAEDSFLRINQRQASISAEELDLIKHRKFPNAIAARAVIRFGTGHKYWSSFATERQSEIRSMAEELFEAFFKPRLRYPIKSIDLPIGGKEYSATALSMVFDFIKLAVGTPDLHDDTDGSRTVSYLQRTRKVARLICSNHPSSLGLHPAIYFYSWTGKQQPILLLVFTELAIRWEQEKKLPAFIKIRSQFESFLLENQTLINQIIRKFGTKDSGKKHLRDFYLDLIERMHSGMESIHIVQSLRNEAKYRFLQPEEGAYTDVRPTRFSQQVKSGITARELLKSAPRCAICGGYMPSQAISIDHKTRVSEGGASNVSNAQLTHPYCNTGIKS